MKNREDKKKDFQELREALEKVNNLFVASFEKMTVDQDFNLRKTVRSVGGSYRVVKNNIAEIASAGLPAEDVLKGLKGMTSVASWIPGVNNLGTHGRWAFAEFAQVYEIESDLQKKVDEAFDQLIGSALSQPAA